MAQQGKAPLASMGIDAPLACLSKKTRSFYDYFYQLFAQVTNPPIDALREHMVTSTTLYLGNHGNLLEDSRTACQLVRLERPLLSAEEFDRIRAIDRVGFKTRRFRAVYRRDAGEGALQAALKQLAEDVEAAVCDGVNIVVLSDRAAAGEVPVPSLLAVGCVHNHLIRAGVRTFADIVVECGDAVSPHDFAALDRKSTRLSSHTVISYAVFCLKKKKTKKTKKKNKKTTTNKPILTIKTTIHKNCTT